MEIIFQNILDEFGDKKNIFDDMVDEVKTLSHTELDALKQKISRLEAENSQLTVEAIHLQASIVELREEVVPLQEDNNRLFDAYQALKEDYESLLLQLTEKDKTIQDLLVS